MSFRSNRSAQPPLSPELSDIIDKYASPSSSVASSMSRREEHRTATARDQRNAPDMSSPSPSPTYGTTSPPSQLPSTNASYLRRSKLLGQSISPKLVAAPVDLSRALNYFHDGASPMQHSSSPAPSTPSIWSSHSTGRNSMPHFNRDAERVATLDASKLKSSPDGSEDVVRSKTGYFSAIKHQDHANRDEDSTNIKIDSRKTSPATEALRQSLAPTPQPSSPRHMPQSSWASRLFGRLSSNAIARPTSPKSSISDDNISDFEYVEPRNATESPKAILDRIRARGAALKAQSSEAMLSTVSSFVSELDDDERYVDGMSPSRRFGLVRTPLALSTDEAVGTGPVTPSDWSVKEQTEHVAEDTQEIVKEDASDSLEASQCSNERFALAGAHAPCLALSPVSVIFGQIPTLPQQRLAVSAWTTIINQAPQALHQTLAMSPITSTFAQEPILPRASMGLSFITANAIIYGCMTFTTMLFVIRNIDKDFECGRLVADMGYASLVAVFVCVVLHVDVMGKIWTNMKELRAAQALKEGGQQIQT